MLAVEDTTINIKKGKLAEQVLIEGIYKDEDVLVKKWEAEKGANIYLAQMKKGGVEYIGALNSNFEKEGYGLLKLPNGERYFGVFTADKRDKHGIYQFPDKISKDGKTIEREFFFGVFNEGKIDERGVYMWIKEDKKVPMFNDFDKASFSCFVGDLDNEHFKKGTYLTKDGDSYYVYYGTFNENNEKDGKNVFYYNADKDQLLFGTVESNKFKEGYLAQFNEDGNIEDGLFCTYDDEGKITSYKQKEEMPESQKIYEEMFKFRNKIMEEDYFGEAFNAFKGVNEIIDTKANLKTFEDANAFPKIINATYDFNKVSIGEAIQSVIGEYE